MLDLTDVTTVGSLASFFQVTATVGFAIAVLKSPSDSAVTHLDRIISREESILGARDGEGAAMRRQLVLSARVSLKAAMRRIDTRVQWHEGSIWLSCVFSSIWLIYCTLMPLRQLSVGWALVFEVVALAWLALSVARILMITARETSQTRVDVQAFP